MNTKYFNNLIKLLGQASLAVSCIMATSCSDDIATEGNQPLSPESSDMTLSVVIPDLIVQQTRTFDNGHLASSMKLTVFEFALGTDATNTFPTRTYQAESTITGDASSSDGIAVTYKIPNLVKTNSPRVLHFVVTDDYLTIPYGSEAAVFSALSVSNQTRAYWGRVEFPQGYARVTDQSSTGVVTDMTFTDEAKAKFQNIPLIRNFACVSMQNNVAETAFRLQGFRIINEPVSGTVAPYNVAKKAFASLLNGNSMKSFDEIAADYQGIMPPDVNITNQEESARLWSANDFSTATKYLYEHPFESTRRTYVIVCGYYNGSTEPSYYKIDLGKKKVGDANDPDNGMFEYYAGIIRNINYAITITDVSASGYASVSDAINGVTFNNISADVDTRNMLNISDGSNMIAVNKTAFVITDKQPFDFYYQYTSGLGNEKGNANSQIDYAAGGLKTGNVIESFTPPVEVDLQGEKWMKVTITPTEIVGGDGKRQQFWIKDNNGLGREITLFSRIPYDYSNIVVYPGEDNEYTATTAGKGTVSPQATQPFTVYFNLPAGMPEEIFPLEFVLESNRQNMENNPIGTLAVTMGETFFPTTQSYVEPQIKYVKTVSYLEYRYKYLEGTNNVDLDTPNPDHLVRCRFRTINSLANLPGNPAQTTTYVVVYNDYFNSIGSDNNYASWPGVTSFTRTQ